MTSNFVYDFEYVKNEKENYFTYSVNSVDVISRFVMDLSGQIKQFTWVPASKQWILFWSQPRAQCEVYALCGAFGSCNENTLPFCDCITGFRERSPEHSDLGDHNGGCLRNNLLITVNSYLLIPSSKRTEIMKTSIPVTENLPANEQRNWFSAKTNSSAS